MDIVEELRGARESSAARQEGKNDGLTFPTSDEGDVVASLALIEHGVRLVDQPRETAARSTTVASCIAINQLYDGFRDLHFAGRTHAPQRYAMLDAGPSREGSARVWSVLRGAAAVPIL